ncbi:hypothetical protein DFH06DRAFT_1068097 [Mycena polygramma]|nr:hypothetical protein DFH06DRAFT_1068097 [Mycena polygramma]
MSPNRTEPLFPASRSRERVPFPREDAPAMPTRTPTPSSFVHPQPPMPSASGSRSASSSTHGHSTGSAHGHSSAHGHEPVRINTDLNAVASSSSAVTRSLSLPSPRPGISDANLPTPTRSNASNSHIPLAMQRPRDMSDPHAALLATAAARAPGSPPHHMQSHMQYPGQSAYAQPSMRATSPTHHASSSSTRQRTPERTVVPGQRSASDAAVRDLERQGSFRAEGGSSLAREGSFRSPELALGVKRLMAKPASVSATRGRESSDGGSTGAESSGPEVHIRRKRYDAAGRRVERVDEEVRATRSEDGHATRRSEDRTQEREREKKERELALAFVGPHGGADDKPKEKRQKNVLKRRPSANRPSTAPPSAPPSPSPAVTSHPRSTPESRGPPVLSLNLSLAPMPSFDGSSPRGSPKEGSGSGSGPLTPAGAVAQAYKRGLDTSASSSPLPSPSSSIFRRKQAQPSETGHSNLLVAAAETTSPVTPYYTVFGSTSGRVVAVGGPDDAWDGSSSLISASAFPMFDGSRRSSKPVPATPSVGRTLSRKVSERFVRKREESEDDLRGRSAQQGDRRKKSEHSGSRAPGDASPARGSDWAKSSSTLANSYDDGFTNEPRSRRSEPALGGGGKLWKLMKRISTGGLKDKYERGARSLPPIPPLPPVPPVPQLPRDVALDARGATSTDGHPRDEQGALSRFMQSRSSMSASTPPSGIPRSSARALPMPPPIPASHHPRASIATRSSSPVSSDVASSKYFHKTPGSARSSTSSFAEDAAAPPLPDAPMPNVILGKHIVPPKDLYKLDLNALAASGSLDDKKITVNTTTIKPMAFFGTQNIRTPDDWRIVNTPAQEHPPSLPHPPRRLPVPNSHPNASPKESKERRYSNTPSIPEFSTAAPINAFAARKLPPTDPPREHARRMSSAPDESVSRQMSVRSTAAPSGDAYASTARQKRLQQRSTSLPRAEPLFRDMSEKATAQALTEKEKAARWDDLLQRSDRAGGTLHLGTSDALRSDDLSLRYSTSSAQLLNDF